MRVNGPSMTMSMGSSGYGDRHEQRFFERKRERQKNREDVSFKDALKEAEDRLSSGPKDHIIDVKV